MDIQKTAKEIGLFETALNMVEVSNSADVVNKVGYSMPLPDSDITKRIKVAAKRLIEIGKTKYMFFIPEIAIIEELRGLVDTNKEIIIDIPCDLEAEAKQRLRSNYQGDTNITLLEEPFFPEDFYPSNGIIVITGYLAGNRAMVLPETYRLVEHYSGFLGKKMFVPYKELKAAMRYDGWLELSDKRLSEKWRIAI